MKSVHILGLGFIVGMLALGAMLAVIGYRWQQESFAGETTETGFPPGSAPGPAAPEEVARGSALFQQRCSSCHSIGGGRRVGPDLENVADRRPHDWIIEFIVDPQVVIERNDPIAEELLSEYQTQMPNTNTNPEEAEDILVYIQSESEGGLGGMQTAPGTVQTPGAATPQEPAASPGAAQSTPAAQAPSGAQAGGDAAAGEQTFRQMCSGCHTIGGGPMAGPDLQGVDERRPADELVRFIMDPQQFGSTMPDLGVTQEQSQNLVAYIASRGGGAAPPAASPQPTAPVKAAQPAQQAPAAQPASGAQVAGDPSTGQQLFQERCTACHTIGGGPLAGPDLAGVTQRRPIDEIVQFIVNPQQFGSTMPNVGITPEQSQDIVAHLVAQEGGAAAPGAPAPEVALPEGDPRVGRALFVGEQQVSGGGPACIACHNAAGAGALGGGTWAVDLTGAVDRLGAQGFASIVKAPPFPAMNLAYGPNAISDQDAAHLVAFLQEAGQAGGAAGDQNLFVIGGLVAFGIMAGASHFIWRGRAREPREPRPGYRGR